MKSSSALPGFLQVYMSISHVGMLIVQQASAEATHRAQVAGCSVVACEARRGTKPGTSPRPGYVITGMVEAHETQTDVDGTVYAHALNANSRSAVL
jgi:hypothetical protein